MTTLCPRRESRAAQYRELIPLPAGSKTPDEYTSDRARSTDDNVVDLLGKFPQLVSIPSGTKWLFVRHIARFKVFESSREVLGEPSPQHVYYEDHEAPEKAEDDGPQHNKYTLQREGS